MRKTADEQYVRNLVLLKTDLKKELTKEINLRGKDLSWLCYFEKKDEGFCVLEGKEEQYIVLKKVTTRVSSSYPTFTEGEVVEVLMELLNSSRTDF